MVEKTKNKIIKIYEELFNEYGSQGWWPITPTCTIEKKPEYGIKTKTKSQQLEIAIGAILTQNTNWKNAEKAILNIYKNNLMDKEKLLSISNEDLAKIIKPSGYYNQKSKKIKEFLSFNSEMTRSNLLKIWGLGPETVDSILLYAYDKEEFVVDAYTIRMFSKYSIVKSNNKYENVKELFENSIKDEIRNQKRLVKIYKEYHALIVEHGKRYYSKKPYGSNDPIIEKISNY